MKPVEQPATSAVVACGPAPATRIERLALATARFLQIADTPPVANIETAEWRWVRSSSLETALRGAGRSARAARDRRWADLTGRHLTVTSPLLVAAIPLAWWLGGWVITILWAQVTLCWSSLSLMALEQVDRTRTARSSDAHLVAVGLTAIGGIGSLASTWAAAARSQQADSRDRLVGDDAPIALGTYLDQLGFTTWFDNLGLDAGQRETFDALLPEHTGTLAELARIAAALA